MPMAKELDAVLQHVVESACAVLDARCGGLFTLTESGDVDRVVMAGPEAPTESAEAKTGAAAVLDMLGDHPVSLRLPPVEAEALACAPADVTRPFLGVPIYSSDQLVGALYLSGKRNGDFTEADASLADTLAHAAAMPIRNARVHLELSERQDAWMHASLDIISRLLTGVPRQEALELVAERARSLAGGVYGAIVLPTDNPDQLLIEAIAGEEYQHTRGMRVGREGTVSGQVMRTGEAQVLEAASEAVAVYSQEGRPTLGPMVVVPLAAGHAVLGTLLVGQLAGARPFTGTDVRMVHTFANHAALAMELARGQERGALLAVYEDRDRIAVDLHDFVIQRLYAAGMTLQSLHRHVHAEEAVARLNSVVEALDGAMSDIRRTIFALQRPTAGANSLREQILHVTEGAVAALGFRPRVAFGGPVDTLVSASLGDQVLAVLREGLSNTARHAKATSMSIDVCAENQEVRVEITDDGRGVGDVVRRSGLANLQQRAERNGGNFEVFSPGGVGTRLVWQAPLDLADLG